MLCVNGWGRDGRYYGSGMGALRERNGVGMDVITVYYGADMNALLRHVRDLGFSSAENTVPTCVFGMLPKRNTGLIARETGCARLGCREVPKTLQMPVYSSCDPKETP